MSYDQKISRDKPGLIVMVIDDSGSMSASLPGTSDAAFKWTELQFGHILKDLLDRSTEVKGDNQVVIKPRFYVHVIHYGSSPKLWGNPEMDIQAAVQLYTQSNNSLGLGGSLGGTDARAAFEEAYRYLTKALSQERFKRSFPPMLFHLTDGESQTEAGDIADQIKQLSTADGNVLIVNAYIGTSTSLSYKGPDDFTGYLTSQEAGPSSYNEKLFTMSSVTPDCVHANLKAAGIFPNLRPGARLFFDVRTREMLKHAIQVIGSLGSNPANTLR